MTGNYRKLMKGNVSPCLFRFLPGIEVVDIKTQHPIW